MSAPYRQRVPRPLDARPGPPAPWLACAPAARGSASLDRLRLGLAGLAAPRQAAAVNSAVLVPVVERGGEAALVLIRRSEGLGRDPGQIAFPGGHLEAGEQPLEAALREASEEIGLDPDLVEVVAEFGIFERGRQRERVVPFVGIVTGRPSFLADGREVAAILAVPVASLAADGVSWQERWGPDDAGSDVCFFAGTPELGDDLVWGLTARIVWKLLAAIFGET